MSKRTVLHYKDRDIIRVNFQGRRQGFYRSTGRNSGKPGVWFPFDGIALPAWFDKEQYCNQSYNKNRVPDHLHRYGTEDFKQISDKLAKQNIPKGREVDEIEVNEFVGAKGHAENWRAVRELYKGEMTK